MKPLTDQISQIENVPLRVFLNTVVWTMLILFYMFILDQAPIIMHFVVFVSLTKHLVGVNPIKALLNM